MQYTLNVNRECLAKIRECLENIFLSHYFLRLKLSVKKVWDVLDYYMSVSLRLITFAILLIPTIVGLITVKVNISALGFLVLSYVCGRAVLHKKIEII